MEFQSGFAVNWCFTVKGRLTTLDFELKLDFLKKLKKFMYMAIM
jgi:hypothetical protein